jgi:hypothetical protein
VGPGSEKVDAGLRDAMSRASADAPVTVLVRGQRRFTGEQIDDLASRGVRVRMVAGDVLTADVLVGLVHEICDRDYVMTVALSGPLFQEGAEH